MGMNSAPKPRPTMAMFTLLVVIIIGFLHQSRRLRGIHYSKNKNVFTVYDNKNIAISRLKHCACINEFRSNRLPTARCSHLPGVTVDSPSRKSRLLAVLLSVALKHAALVVIEICTFFSSTIYHHAPYSPSYSLSMTI